MVSTQTLQAGDKTFYNGKLVEVVSSQGGFVTVKDSSGQTFFVRKNVLMSNSIYSLYLKKAEQKRKEQIAHYQKQGEQAGQEKAGFIAQIRDFLSQMGLYDKDSKEFKALKDNYWAARMDRTAAGNREYSAYLHAAMVASDPIC